MENTDRDGKTEAPSEKKLKDSADEGNVPMSREIPVAASILVFSVCFSLFGENVFRDLTTVLSTLVETSVGGEPLANRDFGALFSSVSLSIIVIIGPIFGVLVLSGFLSSAAQNEPRLVGKRITPQFSRVSPLAGWKRLFSLKSFVEFLKSLAKLSGALIVVMLAMTTTMKAILETMFQNPGVMALSVFGMVSRLLFWVSTVAVLIAAGDFVWQRISWWRDLKMSKQEVKDEFKQSEGDPIVKSRFRSIGRARARSRMMKAVPTATLIIANPTHIAIALRYDREKDAAPVVVATGADIIALRIRAIAEEHQVPVFERIELARALYKVVKVDQIIPNQFYKALAELIRTIYDKRV